MASFEQTSVLDDPAPDARTLSNSVNSLAEITASWDEYILLIVGSSALVIGLSIILTRFILNNASAWTIKRSIRRPAKNPGKQKRKCAAVSDLTTSLSNIKAFSHVATQLPAAQDGTMHIVSISEETVAKDVLGRDKSSAHKSWNEKPISVRVVFASVNLARLSVEGEKAKTRDASARADLMNGYRLENGLTGLVLCHEPGDDIDHTDKLLVRFRQKLVPIILQADADSRVWDTLDYDLVDGVIVENACIQRNGERRDFFRAARVREIASQCKEVKTSRKDFFFAFLELYDALPTAAVLRRAYKLADFFGALLEAKHVYADPSPIKDIPLSAFDSLKSADITGLQKSWSACAKFSTDAALDLDLDLDLTDIAGPIPAIQTLLQPQPVGQGQSQAVVHLQAPDYISDTPRRKSIWDYTSCGTPLASGGCFALREEVTEPELLVIRRVQKSLKERRMLQLYGDAEVLRITQALKDIARTTTYLKCLVQLLEGLVSSKIKIFAGLDSGFSLPDAGGRVWGLVDEDGEGRLDIHISLKASSDVATIWHTYLAYKGTPRIERFQEELHFKSGPLPASIVKELETSAESELLYLMQQIQLTDTQHSFEKAIVEVASRILLQETTRRAWIALHSKACLDSSLSMRSLIEHRRDYHASLGASQLPTLNALCELFELIEAVLARALLYCDRASMGKLSQCLVDVYAHAGMQSAVTPVVDLYGLLYFCALRKLAYENVYLETTDRCPFFLSQPDQAAVFSELWVLGSQCELYFGILPRALGEITYNQYRKHLTQHPPPVQSWDGKEVFTAYGMPPPRVKAAARATEQREENRPENPRGPPEPAKYVTALQHVGALSIFCVPAIVDVTLLCFLGRGLYLSAWMSDIYSIYADYAIFAALIMTGGITGWVGSTGGFYLYNYAFDNMVHFLVHRLSGSLMLTTAIAILGFIAFGAINAYDGPNAWFQALVFVLYIYPLSIFLTFLGIFATMYKSGSPLPSGRTSMWKCLPILLMSPLLTTFIHGWDLLIYLLVVYTFTFALLAEFRRLCSCWTNWHLKVPVLKENELLKWFKEKQPEAKELDSIALAAAARSALHDSLEHHKRQNTWFKKTATDPFVAKVADGFPEAIFLLQKECANTEMPETFTTTWFVQLELALNNQRQLLRGLREHSAFINYRYSKYDIGQNIGLFLGALMDRIIQIVMSAQTPHTADYATSQTRYAVTFALLHFLLSALSVDIVLQRYWEFASQLSQKRIAGIEDMQAVVQQEEAQHIRRYLRAISELGSLLLIIFGIATILLWLFVADTPSIIIFFGNISSYTAVVVCQFHRCFTKSHRMHVITVLSCCVVGFVVGCLLRGIPATAASEYDFVIGQNIACVPALLGTGYWIFHSPAVASSKEAAAVKLATDISPSPAPPPAAAGHGSSCSEAHNVHSLILQHICLGINVNTAWATLHEDVRRLIIGRLLGHSTELTSSTKAWTDARKQSIAYHDNNLQDCLDDHNARRAQPTAPQSEPAVYELTSQYDRPLKRTSLVVRALTRTQDIISNTVKWIAIISAGTPDTPRELWYTLRSNPFRHVLLWTLLKIWKVCWRFRMLNVHIFAIKGKSTLGSLVDLIDNGARRTLRGATVTVNTPTWKITGFLARSPAKLLGMIMYDGLHSEAPEVQPIAVNFYDDKHRLRRRQEIGADAMPIEYSYTYFEQHSSRWPLSKILTDDGNDEQRTNYDSIGRPTNGTFVRGDARWEYQYFYKEKTSDSEVLYAIYQRMDGTAPKTLIVYWCVRPRNGGIDWISSEKVQSVHASVDGQTYNIKWVYKHAQGAEILASALDAQGKPKPCLPPAEILDDKLKFLVKPKNVNFDHEDLLVYHPISALDWVGGRSGWFSRQYTKIISMAPLSWLHLADRVVFHKMSTATLRSAIWKAWAKAPFVDAVTASLLDEMVLRKEPLLKRYWALRDAGYLTHASSTLDENLEQIISAMEPTNDSSDKCPLLIKSADLFTMGLGKDTTQLTARLEDAYQDTEQTTSVIFSDNGCWPDNPGGVSNCRRDLVNGHTSIRGHCLAESANDFGVPRYQIERNINTLKVLPLWGLDSKTANHGLFDNLLQTQVDDKIAATKLDEDIQQVFVPLLKTFVLGARTRRYTREHVVQYSNAMLKMSKYFEVCDYNKTWNSELVWKAWLEAWLHDYKDANVRSPSECFELEQPSFGDFFESLSLYKCYFFIYSVQMPEDCPKVFQSTHHGISSLFGVLLKYCRGTTWGLWDHAILWRETCLNISPAQCLLPLSVQSMLLAGVRLATHLAYTHVDIVLPCTSVFNPDWEADLGTDQGLRGSKQIFNRKIDPIVNGIGNMSNFQPVDKIRSTLPTTVMLSNVQFIKDVKTAVLAADVIINKFGFTDYRLIVYGAQDRQPSYALETVNLINSRGLAGKVILGGFGTPKEVLKDAWLFVNSSLSEGLPLAIGEAALSGVPIVATEVGATALVLTDPDDASIRYGEVVPPNDPESLGRAQLAILTMTGPWAKYTKSREPCKLPDVFNAELVKQFTARMYQMAEERRALGLRLREVVLRSFHGHRYLREHEQMYWIQRRQAEIRLAIPLKRHPPARLVYGEKRIFEYDKQASRGGEVKRWQDFDLKEYREKYGLVRGRGDMSRQSLMLESGEAISSG